jgi:hypothetical protein
MKTTYANDSYINDVNTNYFIAFVKSISVPLKMLWWVLKFLVNPKKSKVRALKQVLVYPVLDFFTHSNGSDLVLKDYSYFHEKIRSKEILDENIKINFDAHKAVLINSKIANVITLFYILTVYYFGFILITGLTIIFTALASIFPPILVIAPIFMILKAVLGVAGFAVFWATIKEILITDKQDIKQYLDEIIFYADLKNREIFGDEHADAVRNALYEAYLPQKLEQVIPAQFIDLYPLPAPEPAKIAEKREEEEAELNEYKLVGVSK